MTVATEEVRLTVGDRDVSALVDRPVGAGAAYVFAHGAGAGMRHRFMADCAAGLAERGVATLRYQFPFMERGSGPVGRPEEAHDTVRAACELAVRIFDGLPLFAGGKSYGGRMTTQAQANGPLPGVAGLVLVGFPLHAAGKPSVARAEHLAAIDRPMLFLAGTRDALADATLMARVVAPLDDRARVATFEDADHAFHVRKTSGGDDAQTLAAMLDAASTWMATVAAFDASAGSGA